MWKKILGWALVIGIVATVINDTGRYFTGWRVAENAANEAAAAAAGSARKDRNRRKAWSEVYNTAAKLGATAENVDLTDSGAQAWVRYDVRGTWALGPIIQMSKGVWDLKTWWSTPIPIRSNSTAMY